MLTSSPSPTPVLPPAHTCSPARSRFITLDDLCGAAKEVAPLSLGVRPEVLAGVFREAQRAQSGRVDKHAFVEIVAAGGQ